MLEWRKGKHKRISGRGWALPTSVRPPSVETECRKLNNNKKVYFRWFYSNDIHVKNPPTQVCPRNRCLLTSTRSTRLPTAGFNIILINVVLDDSCVAASLVIIFLLVCEFFFFFVLFILYGIDVLLFCCAFYVFFL